MAKVKDMEKRIPKHEKMYANSPTLETDENGKKYIKKGPSEAEKETARTSDGTQGTPITEQGSMYERHMEEVSDMHDRHLTERKDMVKRHMKEMKKSMPEESEGSTGKEMVKKVEKNKAE